MIVEMFATFIFVSVVLNIKYLNGSSSDAVNAFAVSFALVGCIIFAGPISGAALNPAVGICQSVFQMILSDNYGETKWFSDFGKSNKTNHMWLYILGDFIGAIAAGIFANINAGEMRYRKYLAWNQ